MRTSSFLAVAVLAGTTQGAITVYTSHDGGFVPVDTAIFDDTVLGQQPPFTTDTQPGVDTHGINVTSIISNGFNGFWGYAFPGGDGTPSCYFNGGKSDIMSVTKLDASDFNQIEMQVGNGQGAEPEYVWAEAYNNGVQVGSFDIDMSQGGVLGMKGGGFDNFRIQVYNNPGDRNAHNESTYGAAGIDNFAWDGGVPAPGTATLLGLGGLMAGRRRR